MTRHDLETVAGLTGVARREILVYCRSGLVSVEGSVETEELFFDDEALYRIRRIEEMRTEQGINLAGIRMIFELLNEVQRLREEMRFLRS
jgi:DNA-binding transcriptional MerR regulator